MRACATVAAAATAGLVLSGCSNIPFLSSAEDDVDVATLDYCERVDHFEDQVLSLGRVKTDEAFEEYVVVLETIAERAPSDEHEDAEPARDPETGEPGPVPTVQGDWAAWAELTRGFLAAHQGIGFSLEDRYDPEKVAALSDGDKVTLNNATFVYNVGVDDLRPRLVEHLQASCSIDLSAGAPPELDDPAEENGDD